MRHFSKRQNTLEGGELVRYKLGAYGFMVSKGIIAFTTYIIGTCFLCANPVKFAIHSFVHILLFGHFIYIGLSFVCRILAVTSIIKAIINITDFLVPMGLTFNIPVINMPLLIGSMETGKYVFIINALFSFAVAILLINAVIYSSRVKKNAVLVKS